MFYKISFNANNVDPDQNAAEPDLGLSCLPTSLKWGARHGWVKGF